jgi:hypothetical protein
LTFLGGIQMVLFGVAVACVVTAVVTARRNRRTSPEHSTSWVSWWRGQPRPVHPVLGLGWALFVFLNVISGLAIEPLLACGLFMRAWVLRAVCLRRGRPNG